MTDPAWEKPRRVTVLVDNDSWILPYAERLVREVSQTGDTAQLVRRSDDLPEGDVAFLLGCVRIVPSRLMNRSRINLVVHASDLPRGRGFSPMTWQILEGRNTIPICLFVAARDVDSGPVIFRDTITLKGTEVCEEWRIVVGERTLKLCKRYLNEPAPPAEKTQLGEATFYPRRTQYDSRLDPNKTIAEQFGDGGSLFSCSRTSEPIRFWTHSSHERRQRDSLPRRGDQAGNVGEFARRVPDLGGRWLLVTDPATLDAAVVRSSCVTSSFLTGRGRRRTMFWPLPSASAST